MPSPTKEEILHQWPCIGIVGAGSMGSQMAVAFAEIGLHVSIWDVNEQNVDSVAELVRTNSVKGQISTFHEIDPFVESVQKENSGKLFLFSISHGDPADSVLGMIKEKLGKGDIILDGGNEHYRRTQRRQKECAKLGVHWIGMGVSGGYQAARRGPSLSPGGDAGALEKVMPLLRLYAAKDLHGKPCVTRIGPDGAGHYVKMVHNSIEGGMLSALAEAWSFLTQGLGLNYEDIANIFERWNTSGELHGNYLLEIAVDMLRTKKSVNGKPHYILDEVLDKVVQDDDDTEGTPHWAIEESAARHVSSPTLAAAHYLRVASGNRAERLEGLELIQRASDDENWDIDLTECLRIWRGGCIIRSDGIADLIEPIVSSKKGWSNLKHAPQIARELSRTYNPLKTIVLKGVLHDQYLPAISATLEYLKYVHGTRLPTQFMEGQMDFFGSHGYNKPGVPGEDPGPVAKGPHHYEWRPADA
ncbi:hypothetical protein N7468_008861 [Penicillium chermesinum]|uniref:phosphogluconate dehydrogenase (NADP(+)-dependent, decarboxylating) n=1 Tax=Penicillium chermesinum TaxID=63820 RepID=A0A9W9NGP8_9EURO|nr:uncharacterized protein N7468_008861 [Penicillium chermesinum]KAJ5219657.1 hypothetical protein N7468_008861 [Penicillium chermesinum]